MSETRQPTRSNQAPAQGGDSAATPERLAVARTCKLYIGGKFPRTESGRTYPLKSSHGQLLANLCLASRKDLRNAVVAARASQRTWADASAYLRSQILYRAAEMMEGRASQFASELVQTGADPSEARAEVTCAIDRLVHYAGWADKYQQVFSSVNPVASPHFNFSVPVPTGVVGAVAPESSGLAGLVSVIAPAIAGANAVVVLASHTRPLSAVTLAEVLATSDLPGGVVNLLTGERDELLPHLASHMDVNAVVACDLDNEQVRMIQMEAAGNIKRVIPRQQDSWLSPDAQGPYLIMDTQELKTTWHPVGV